MAYADENALLFTDVSQLYQRTAPNRPRGPAILKMSRSFAGMLALWLAVFFAPVLLGQTGSNDALPPASFDSIAETARTEREAGNSEKAIRAYQSALQIRPDWEEGWWYLGTLQYDSDHYADAIPAFHNLLKIDPKMGPAWTFLGLCEFETRDYSNSLHDLSQGQTLGGDDDPDMTRVARFHLALLLNRNGEFEKAFAVLASETSGKASDPVKTSFGMSLLRVPLLPNDVDPSQDGIIQAAGEAAFLLSKGEQDKALDALRDLAKDFSNAPYVHYAYGVALEAAGQTTEALLQQKAELKISPAIPLPLIEISKLELRSRHFEGALQAAEKAVHLAPDSFAAHRALAQALQAMGRKEKASAEFRTAESLTPEKPAREARIVQLYSPRPVNASLPLTAASARPSESFEDLSSRAAAAEKSGDLASAVESYEQALQLRPNWDEGRWHLSMLEFSSAHYPEAMAALKVCVAHQPKYGTAWAMLGLAEFASKDYDNALIHLQRGQDLGMGGTPESLQIARYRLGMLLNRSGEFDQAADILGSAAESGPLEQQVQFALGMSLLHVAAFPDQVDPSQHVLMQTAGAIALNLQKSKYDDAFAKFNIILRDYPQVPFVHYACGTAHAALSEYAQAESEFRKEMAISPKSELPYVRLASAFLRQFRAADALPLAKEAVQLNPDSAAAHYMLGRSYLETGDTATAITELETSEKMAPSSPEVHFNLAKAYARAKLTDKAKEERTIFAQLNAIAEERRSSHGVQSYGGSRDMSDFNTTGTSSSQGTTPP